MKKVYLLILLAVAWQLTTFAQSQHKHLSNQHPMVHKRFCVQHPANSHAANKAMATNSRIRAEMGRSWDGSAWEDGDSTVYIYNGTRGGVDDVFFGGKYDTANYIGNNGTTWLTENRLVREYNANNWLINEYYYENQSGTFTQAGRNTITRDAQGKVTSFEYAEWVGGMWEPTDRFTYTYDANNNITSETEQEYTGGAWVNTSRYTSSYNANGKPLTDLSENWINNAWIEYDRTTNTYNPDGTLASEVLESSNGTANWEFTDRYTYTYNTAGYSTVQLLENYVNSAWEDSYKKEYTRDANGNMTEENGSSWDGSVWQPGFKNFFRYNSYNQVILDSILYYDGSGWENSYWGINYYETYEDGGNSITELPTLTSSVMPNPFIVNVSIQLNVTQAGNHTFEVYNITGQRVYTESRQLTIGQQTIVWDGQEAPTGVYFYKIFSQNGIASGKLVKQ